MRLDTFNGFVQNEKRGHSTEQRLLKTKLRLTVTVREHSQCLPGDKWLVDSGASGHMTPKREYFTKYRSFSTPEKVGLGDGRVVEAVGTI